MNSNKKGFTLIEMIFCIHCVSIRQIPPLSSETLRCYSHHKCNA